MANISFTDMNSDGNRETFRAGDSTVIPGGTLLAWRMPKNLREFHVILDSTADRKRSCAQL